MGIEKERKKFRFVSAIFAVALLLMGAGSSPWHSSQELAAVEMRPDKKNQMVYGKEQLNNYIDSKYQFLLAAPPQAAPPQGIDRTLQNPWMAKGEPIMVGTYLCFDNWLFDLFYFAPDYANQYADAINKYDKAWGGSVRMHVLLVPTACEFRMPEPYWSKRCAPQDKAIQYVYGRMNPRINTVDAYSNMALHQSEYLFFRSDHHWTALGAYRGYEALISSMGQAPVPLETYPRIDSKQSFYGSLYSLANIKEKKAGTADQMWYYNVNTVPYTFTVYNEGKASAPSTTVFLPGVFSDKVQGNEYSVFLKGDHPYCKIKTEQKNGKKLLVIKDSYGNALIPFLVPHFEEIHVVDPRHYKSDMTGIVGANGITDVLFVDYAQVTGIPSYSEQLSQLLH